MGNLKYMVALALLMNCLETRAAEPGFGPTPQDLEQARKTMADIRLMCPGCNLVDTRFREAVNYECLFSKGNFRTEMMVCIETLLKTHLDKLSSETITWAYLFFEARKRLDGTRMISQLAPNKLDQTKLKEPKQSISNV